MQVKIDDLVEGETYDIKSDRKGNFRATLLKAGDTFASFRIVSGEAHYLTEESRSKGETLDLRLYLATFYEIS